MSLKICCLTKCLVTDITNSWLFIFIVTFLAREKFVYQPLSFSSVKFFVTEASATLIACYNRHLLCMRILMSP